jgi:hypothetical protein
MSRHQMTLEAPITDRAGRDRQHNPRGDLVDILLLPQAQDFSNEPLQQQDEEDRDSEAQTELGNRVHDN